MGGKRIPGILSSETIGEPQTSDPTPPARLWAFWGLRAAEVQVDFIDLEEQHPGLGLPRTSWPTEMW